MDFEQPNEIPSAAVKSKNRRVKGKSKVMKKVLRRKQNVIDSKTVRPAFCVDTALLTLNNRRLSASIWKNVASKQSTLRKR